MTWQTRATDSSNGSVAFPGSNNNNNTNNNNPRCKFCWAGVKSFISYRERDENDCVN